MSPNARLRLCVAMIVISAIYAVLVAEDAALAAAIASGYVALVVTVFVVINVWKRP